MSNYLNFKSQYNRFPENEVTGYDCEAWEGYPNIINKLKEITNGVICFESYPGVDYPEIINNLIEPLNPDYIFNIEELTIGTEAINNLINRNLTDDRVFGLMSHHIIDEFYDIEKIKELKNKIKSLKGLIIIYGFGASLIEDYNHLVYLDLARWEIQQRYRNKMSNWQIENSNEDVLRKYKRGFFVEWRVADRLKKKLYKSSKIDYILDTNKKNNPKMVTIAALNAGLDSLVKKPFRLVPYFDPGVWGGQWMKEVCNLPLDKANYAWSFDGVPEENSLYLKFGEVTIEIPSINLVFFRTVPLLGTRVHARFGTEFPIRFDFLDTMEGGNLSLQVHPLTEYIYEKFGMPYTQDESYYILDAKPGAYVYAGVKTGVKKEELVAALREAQTGKVRFDDEKFINKFNIKKHDHISFPAGTIHASASGSMVLEISATPYIFTFKLWDWDRLGLDGLPRPVHIDHGEQVIETKYDTEWVKSNIINNFVKINEVETRTGLHERQFIETRTLFFTEKVTTNTEKSVNMLNVVEGSAIIVESPTNMFKPFEVHYAETFIVPENLVEYTIRPKNKDEYCGVLKAYVRCQF